MKKYEEIESGSKKEQNTMLPLDGDNDVEYFVDVKILIVKYALSVQINEDEK